MLHHLHSFCWICQRHKFSDIAENPIRHLPYRFSCLDRLADQNRLLAGRGAPSRTATARTATT